MSFACVICLDCLNSKHSIVATDCGHVFHLECLSEWIQKSRTCPECRGTFPGGNQFKKIFPNETEDQRNMEALESQLSLLQKDLDDQKSLVLDLLEGLKSPKKRKRRN